MTAHHTATARRLKQLLIEISPLIEEYTAVACPSCAEVCCRQKFGLYRAKDLEYLRFLGTSAPRRDETRPLDGPCEAMGSRGCMLPRWMRPFRCTWFFCDSLLTALDQRPGKQTRKLSLAMQEMIDLHETIPAFGSGCFPPSLS